MEIYDVNKSAEVTSYMEEYAADNPNRKWMCEHYHREYIDQKQGIEENRPKEEEFWEYEIPPSPIMRPFGHNFYVKEEPKIIIYYDIKTSDLVPISDKECQCSKCRKIFEIEKMEQMNQVFHQMNKLYDEGIYCLTNLDFLKLMKGLEPVWYRKNTDGSNEILGIEENVRKWTLGGREDNYDIPDKYVKKDAFVQLPELKISYDKEAKGCSHFAGKPCMVISAEASSKQLRIIGEVEATLTIDSKGICKCSECGKMFSAEEQQQLQEVVSYLNTPHYLLEEDMMYHESRKDVLDYYNHGYLEENNPFGLFSIDKALKLSKGLEPVLLYRYFYNDSKKKILTTYRWNQGKWTIKNKIVAYLKLKISKST